MVPGPEYVKAIRLCWNESNTSGTCAVDMSEQEVLYCYFLGFVPLMTFVLHPGNPKPTFSSGLNCCIIARSQQCFVKKSLMA